MKASTFFALLTGAAAGITLGVLFAPEKGEENRKKVKKAVEDCFDKVKEKMNDFSADSKAAENVESSNTTQDNE